MIEKFSNHPHIKALKNANHFCSAIIADNHSVLTQGTATTAINLYTSTNHNTAKIFVLKLHTAKIDFILLIIKNNYKVNKIIIHIFKICKEKDLKTGLS